MLIGLRKLLGTRLARGLLQRVPRIVSDTVLYTLVIYCVGCIIPTPLDRAPSHPNVGGPSIVSAMPDFGKIGPFGQTEGFDLSLTITDPDVGMSDSQDDIRARLYRIVQGQKVWDGEEITLMAATPPDPNNLQLRFGTFNSVARCFNFGLMAASTELYVAVSDRTFVGSTVTSNGGFSESNHWTLQCL
jgi:hypothetical protein